MIFLHTGTVGADTAADEQHLYIDCWYKKKFHPWNLLNKTEQHPNKKIFQSTNSTDSKSNQTQTIINLIDLFSKLSCFKPLVKSVEKNNKRGCSSSAGLFGVQRLIEQQ